MLHTVTHSVTMDWKNKITKKRKQDCLFTYINQLEKNLLKDDPHATMICQRVASMLWKFNNKKSISLKDIDANFVKRFRYYLIRQDIKTIPVSFCLNYFRKVYNEAIRDNIISPKEDPFLHIQIREKNFPRNISESAHSYIKYLCRELIKDNQPWTVSAYHKLSWMLWNFNKKEKVLLEDIDLTFVHKFESYLIAKKETSASIAFYLHNLATILNRAFQEGVILKKDTFFHKKIIQRKKFHQKQIFGLLGSYVDRLNKELINNNQERTAQAYVGVVNKIQAFTNKKTILLEDIDRPFIEKFENYLFQEKNTPNTVSFYLRNLRAIHNKAVKDGIIKKKTDNLFHKIYTSSHTTNKQTVHKEVLIKLKNLHFPEVMLNPEVFLGGRYFQEGLPFARDMFLLSFYSQGIFFRDMAYLRKTDLEGNSILYNRENSDLLVEIIVTPQIREIVNYYTPWCEESKYLLPILPKQDDSESGFQKALRLQNRRLKCLSEKLGLNANLTTHMTHHSWAAIAHAHGCPLDLISQGLGHKTLKETHDFLKQIDHSMQVRLI